MYCADTNEPARFAKVQLEAIPDAASAAKPASEALPKGVSRASVARISTITETALDGSFMLSKVKPGNYYVVVEKSGYIKPRDMFTAKEIADPSKEMKAVVEAVLPRVRVEANQTERAEVRMERGAAISGTVRYDDGSPAAEVEVELMHKDAKGEWVAVHDQEHASIGRQSESTDDRGYFRLPSLLPDEYLVKVMLRLSDTKLARNGEGDNETMYAYFTSRFELPFYGAGVARQKDAATIKLTSGQELTGQDMLLPVGKLRHVTGRVAAGADSHIVNAAKVSMVTRDDGKELASSRVSREDGLFHFDFVPDGDYLLKVTDVRDVTYDPVRPDPKAADPFEALKPQDKERTLQTYGNTELPMLLDGNRDGITITVPRDAKPPKSAAKTENE